MKHVPMNGSKWRNRRTREICTVEYHPCGAAAGFSMNRPGKGYGADRAHVFTSADADNSFTSRYTEVA
jgi:hypothetical protein